MRLHHLQVTAFGPFAETVEVDFDELSGAGLFLLSGATGAGKTSVLDAICFALYGDVPGDRASAKRLRCDQADPRLAPQVVLEASLGGRRFRFVRSPMWERPKRRGVGLTTQQAAVSVSEQVDGLWVHLSSRLDEAGHLVTSLVGMNLTQFTQVAMLPQGRFQAFLRARSEDRHQLLQQLFRTGRFADAERWLRERRLRLRRDSDLAHQSVADLVSRASETAMVALPDEWDLHDLSLPAEVGDLRQWTAALWSEAVSSLETARRSATESDAAESAARSSLEQGRLTHDRLARHAAARTEHDELMARDENHIRDGRRLDAARRAASLHPLVRLSAQSRAHLVEASAARSALTTPDREAWQRQVEQSVESAAAARALLPRQARLVTAAEEIRDLEARAVDVAQHLHEIKVRQQLSDLSDRIATLAELELVTAAHEVAREASYAAREITLGHQDQLLSLREARLDAMAGEIAGALAVGACCPVCGSAEHPHKAIASPGAPDAASEKAALKAVDDAKATEHLRDVELRDLAARQSVLADRAGSSDAAELRAQSDELEAELRGLLVMGRASPASAGSDPDNLQREAGEAAARIDALTEECAALRDEIDDVLRDTGCDELVTLLGVHTDRVAAGRLALRALDTFAHATAAAADAERALFEAALETGFDSPVEAAKAILDAGEVEKLSTQVAHHDRRVVAVREILGEPGADEVDSLAPPDLDRLAVAHDSAAAVLAEVRGQVTVLATRSARLEGLHDELGRTLQQWDPLRADVEVASRLASFVEGRSADNRLQMRLSAYVLAYRLSQVVAAANERLSQMSDQRYSLEHSGRRGAGETRGGLSLLVRDEWSGESRDPATLSGGETFVVSLALALGLSDVITDESDVGATGAGLDTLFIDEGFGSLDAETLDDVMDTLDSLRDGGRVVAVVSHVAEMRDRIPTQLVVSKARHGSTLAVRR